MPSADECRAKSIECLIEADRATDPQVGEQLVRLAMAYVKLAQTLERKARTDLVYETPPRQGMTRRYSSPSLGDAAKQLRMLCISCERCNRFGRYRVDKLIDKYGPDITQPVGARVGTHRV